MNSVEKMNKPILKKAEHRLPDLFSDSSSPFSKGNAARWYAEMIIDSFLSDKIKSDIGVDKFKMLSLGEKIEKIGLDFGSEIKDSLFYIKEFGDKASHYDPDTALTDDNARNVVEEAVVHLIVLVAVDELKKKKLSTNLERARILSTMLPSVREAILEKLLDTSVPLDDYNKAILHKYCLACTKNERFNKARRKLDDLLKKNLIEKELHIFEIESIKKIANGMRADELPVPKTMEDSARNFNNVLNETSSYGKNENIRLIEILRKLLENISPSQMGKYTGDKIYHIDENLAKESNVE